jgi:hypothetical protein
MLKTTTASVLMGLVIKDAIVEEGPAFRRFKFRLPVDPRTPSASAPATFVSLSTEKASN